MIPEDELRAYGEELARLYLAQDLTGSGMRLMTIGWRTGMLPNEVEDLMLPYTVAALKAAPLSGDHREAEPGTSAAPGGGEPEEVRREP